MTWTVTKEESADCGGPALKKYEPKLVPSRIHVRAIIDLDNEQAEIKELIAALQKHVKSDE